MKSTTSVSGFIWFLLLFFADVMFVAGKQLLCRIRCVFKNWSMERGERPLENLIFFLVGQGTSLFQNSHNSFFSTLQKGSTPSVKKTLLAYKFLLLLGIQKLPHMSPLWFPSTSIEITPDSFKIQCPLGVCYHFHTTWPQNQLKKGTS